MLRTGEPWTCVVIQTYESHHKTSFTKFESIAYAFQGTILDILLNILKNFIRFRPVICLGSGKVSCTYCIVDFSSVCEIHENFPPQKTRYTVMHLQYYIAYTNCLSTF